MAAAAERRLATDGEGDRHVDRGISNPIELEAPVDRQEPDPAKIADKKIKRAVQKAATGKTLKPVFETVVERTTRTIKAQGSEIELAVDDGEIRAGDETREVREAELELKAGDAEGLLFAAEKLWAGHELKLSSRSKAEHGYRLALHKKGTSTEPEKARPVHIRCKDTCAMALLPFCPRQRARSSLTARLCSRPTIQWSTPVAHRAAPPAKRPACIAPACRPGLSAHIRGLRAGYGKMRRTLRDADVLISGIHAAQRPLCPTRRVSRSCASAARVRQCRRDEVRAVLRGPPWTKLQLYLTLWPHTLDENPRLERPVNGHARKALRKAWKKAAKLGRNLESLTTNTATRCERR